MEKEKKYGERIDLKEAKGLITEYLNLNKQVIMTANTSVKTDPETAEKLKVFVERKYNAFIFTKDLIQRFLDGSEKDEFGNPQASNYLAVILGAHPEKKTVNDEEFEKGSFTVLTVGCRRIVEKINGKNEIRFYPLSIAKPANEYPPDTTITLKPESDRKDIEGSGFEYFVQME